MTAGNLVGRVLGRRYRIVRPLGAGGMGTVYEAVQEDLGRRVAVKVLRPEYKGDSTMLMRFRQEAAAAATLNNPHIVQVSDFVDSGDEPPFLVMEYVDGWSLRRIVEREGPLSCERAANLAAQMLEGLAVAHAARIIHRDIKPDNVMVTSSATLGQIVKILDFGIAKVQHDVTGSGPRTVDGTVLGSLSYMAPEQARGDPIDARVDLYATAGCMYFAVTGKRPLRYTEPGAALLSVLLEDPPRLSEVRSDVDPEFEAIVLIGLSKSPNARFGSAVEMRNAIEAWLANKRGGRAAVSPISSTLGVPAPISAGARSLSEPTAIAPTLVDTQPLAALQPAPPVRSSRPPLPGPPRGSKDFPVPLGAFAAWAIAAGTMLMLVAVGAYLVHRRTRSDSESTRSAAASSSNAESPCTSNRACTESLRAPAVCRARDRRCGPLLSPECSRVAGDVMNDATVVLGSIFSISGPNGRSGLARQNSAELALDEIRQTVGGIPGGPEGRARPLALVECDDTADSVRPASHLVDEVGVPAIVGIVSSTRLTEVANSVAISKGVLMISPAATSTTLTSLPDQNLVWRTAPSDALQAIALVDQLSALEAAYRTAHHIPARTKLALSILYINESYGLELYQAVTTGAQLNGEPIADPANAGLVTGLGYDYGSPDLERQVATVLGQSPRPAIVIAFGSTEVTTKFVAPLESRWGTSLRPFYLFAEATRKSELVDLVGRDDGLRKRVRGTVPAAPASSSTFKSFVFKYEGAFGAPAPAVFGMAGTYDSVFLLAYAIAAAGARPITGQELERGFARLVAGTKIEAGGTMLNSGLRALEAPPGTIDFVGASGPLDFDLASGEARSNIDVWCIAKDAAGKPSFAPSGRLFDATMNQMVGTFDETKCAR